MAHIFIKEEELKRLRSLPEIVDVQGSYGKCYLFTNTTLLKIFSEEAQEIFKGDYQSNLISFPIDTFYTDDINKVQAYTMRYFQGASLYRWGLPEDLEIDTFLKAYHEVLMEMERLNNIEMGDLNSYNILFDWIKKVFYIIDTDGFTEKENMALVNQDAFAYQIMNTMQRRILNWYFHPLREDKELYSLTRDFVYKKDVRLVFLEFMETLQRKVEEEKGKVKTLKELKLPRK